MAALQEHGLQFRRFDHRSTGSVMALEEMISSEALSSPNPTLIQWTVLVATGSHYMALVKYVSNGIALLNSKR